MAIGSVNLNDDLQKGHILYQEDWAIGHNFRAVDIVVIVIMLVPTFIGAFLLIALIRSIYFWGFHLDSIGISFFIVFISIILIIMGIFGFMMLLRARPFRIYENGFDCTQLRFIELPKMVLDFITWDKVEKVTIEDMSDQIYSRVIKIVHSGGRKTILNDETVSDPLKVMRILMQKVSDKMNKEFLVYLGGAGQRQIVKKPYSESVSFRIPDGAMLFLALMMYSMFSVFRISFHDRQTVGYILLFVSFLMSSLITLELTYSYKDNQAKLIRLESKICPDGIYMPHRGAFKLFRRVRHFIPSSEIRAIRTSVDPYYLSTESKVELSNGEEFRLTYDDLEKAKQFSGFREEDQDLVNSHPTPFQVCFTDWNYLGILFVLFLLFVPGIIIVFGM